MIRIRLSKQGKKNAPFYRIVAADKKVKRTGKFIEILGYWNPAKKELIIHKKKFEAWVSKGAQISNSVKKLIGD